MKLFKIYLLTVLTLHAPQPSSYFVRVDFVVVNRVRTWNVSYDDWGRPKFERQEVTWFSFWDNSPEGLISRGWWTKGNLLRITPTTQGWVFQSKDNINVVTREIRIINSHYDWEMRNRKIYRPFRKP